MAPPHHVGAELGTPQSNALASLAASAEIRGNPRQALVLADSALAADARNPWAYYDRAAALARLGQTDEAVQSFRVAEQQFAPDDRWARSLAIYGRAHALEEALRCPEAKAAYGEYASFVEKDDPRSAALARRYANECNPHAPPAPPPAGAPTPPTTPPPPAAPPPATATPPATPMPSTAPMPSTTPMPSSTPMPIPAPGQP
jgi:tetratricopeptide (TPR) repeat protein